MYACGSAPFEGFQPLLEAVAEGAFMWKEPAAHVPPLPLGQLTLHVVG